MIVATLANETYKAMLPENLQLAAHYAYEWLLGAGDWSGYLMAAAYFFGIEFGYGEQLCDAMGYGYEVIDALKVLTDFKTAASSVIAAN